MKNFAPGPTFHAQVGVETLCCLCILYKFTLIYKNVMFNQYLYYFREVLAHSCL